MDGEKRAEKEGWEKGRVLREKGQKIKRRREERLGKWPLGAGGGDVIRKRKRTGKGAKKGTKMTENGGKGRKGWEKGAKRTGKRTKMDGEGTRA